MGNEYTSKGQEQEQEEKRVGSRNRNAKSAMVKSITTKHSRAKRCSWIRVSWTFASATLVTIKQLINPSAMASAIACRSKLCTNIGRASVYSPVSPALDTSSSATSFSVARDAGATRRISLAQRLIARSS